MRNGKGVWKNIATNSLYVGEWRNNKSEGFGTFTYPNGDRYDGEWLSCKKHGRGTDFFANGDTYNGEYIEGLPNGNGIYTWKSGS